MKIELPQVGESVTQGVIGKWLKQVGDRVEKYDPLVEVVTDKVSMEMPSPVTGVLTGILAEEGQTVPMGAAIAEIAVEGEDKAQAAAGGDASTAPLSAEAPTAVDRIGTLLKDVAPVGPTGSGGPISATDDVEAPVSSAPRYSPAVQRLAAGHGVELSQVEGTGVGGRVTRKDVQSYIDAATAVSGSRRLEIARPGAAPEPTREDERVPLSPMRRIIAENMLKSATQVPQAWTMVEADVTGLVQLREGAKAEFRRREGVNLTYLPFVLKTVAESLKESRLLNSSLDGDSIVLKGRINLGVAIATPDGLVVPVVHDADTLGVASLAKAVEDVAARAREGKLALDDVQGGTFTVNNTGALGSVLGKPLINYPQAAIMNTEAIVKRPVVINEAIAIRSIMNLCLTFDHRVLDGAEAGAFLASVKRRLEAIGPEAEISLS